MELNQVALLSSILAMILLFFISKYEYDDFNEYVSSAIVIAFVLSFSFPLIVFLFQIAKGVF